MNSALIPCNLQLRPRYHYFDHQQSVLQLLAGQLSKLSRFDSLYFIHTGTISHTTGYVRSWAGMLCCNYVYITDSDDLLRVTVTSTR